jgi:hypothetical protein
VGRGGLERVAGAALAALLWLTATAQELDAPRAPRILDQPPAGPPRPAAAPASRVEAGPLPAIGPPPRPPNAARLAPLREERRDEPEEIIVIGQGWRLPDLGSEWRARQKEAENEGRFALTLLPLYDPERPTPRSEFFLTPAERHHGYIEIFRLRFGRRSRD